MALLRFPGTDRVHAAHASALPQPDQLCGPFSAAVALHAVLDATQVPSVGRLAAAAGTAIWPQDVEEWRPAGAPLDQTGWEGLALAPTIDTSGTTAADVVRGLESTVGDRVGVVAVPGADLTASCLRMLLTALLGAPYPVGIVANLRTGPIAPPRMDWDVGHFVVLTSFDSEGDVAMVADTYVELGAAGMPPGCRLVPLTALAAALSAPPGRGLVLMARTIDRVAVGALVVQSGLGTGLWET